MLNNVIYNVYDKKCVRKSLAKITFLDSVGGETHKIMPSCGGHLYPHSAPLLFSEAVLQIRAARRHIGLDILFFIFYFYFLFLFFIRNCNEYLKIV